MMTWLQLNLQDAASPLMEELMFFHDFTLMILSFILSFVLCIMVLCASNKILNRFLLAGQTLESVWTMLPMIILTHVALPSLVLLYLMETPHDSLVSVKITGHQWYWSYTLGDQEEFDSIMTPTADLPANGFRLLDVDNRLPLPYGISTSLMITSSDVLHSWTIPSIGVKLDANPGRLNHTNFMLYRPGIFYGQCSEICGANHSFMPIVLESISPKSWVSYLASL
nr:cytochrome c oxidase subunit 2 [Lamproglena orientalis]WKB11720.1 cytochrome c oxidase subunit 2 [Lamproglena orientalis]